MISLNQSQSSKHYTLLEPLIVVFELYVLLAHERVHLGHPHFVLPEQEGRDSMVAKCSIHPPARLKLLDVMLQVLVQSLLGHQLEVDPMIARRVLALRLGISFSFTNMFILVRYD
jgi:hypothetical protein